MPSPNPQVSLHQLARSALIRVPHPPGALAPALPVQIPQPQGAPRHGVGNAVDPLPHRVALILALGLNGLQPIACRVQCIPAKQTANAVSLLDPLVVPRLPRKPLSFFFQFTDQAFHLF